MEFISCGVKMCKIMKSISCGGDSNTRLLSFQAIFLLVFFFFVAIQFKKR